MSAIQSPPSHFCAIAGGSQVGVWKDDCPGCSELTSEQRVARMGTTATGPQPPAESGEAVAAMEHRLAKAIHLLFDHKILTEEERERCAVRWFNALKAHR